MPESGKNYQRRYQREHLARVEAERLLEQKADELYESLLKVQHSENLLASAMKSMGDGLLLVSATGQVVLSNPQLAKIYPHYVDLFKEGVVIKSHFAELFQHPEYLNCINSNTQSEQFEISLSNQQIIAVNVGLTASGDVISTHRNITLQKAQESERNDLILDLMRGQRLETIGRMSGMIAHDFNNILASIKGFAGFIQEDLPVDSELTSYANRILSASAKGQDLISQILEYGNQKRIELVKTSLIPILEDSIDMLTPTIEKRITVHVDTPDDPIWIEGNETRLDQLFTNLLTNAIRALEGEGRLSISVEQLESISLSEIEAIIPERSNQTICSTSIGLKSLSMPCTHITVSDSGWGIEPDAMEKIFDLYFTTRTTGSQGGVGMASVAEIIFDLGGGLRVSSVQGLGTIIDIIFPTSNGPQQVQLQSTETFANQKRVQSREVLLIDDDLDVGEMIKQTLQRNGVKVTYFKSGKDGLNHALTHYQQYALIICDQLMPDIKGTQIYKQLLKAEITIPFYICSGNIDEEIKEMLNNRVIPKPVEKSVLIKIIQSHLN